jgi:hypothetical protein
MPAKHKPMINAAAGVALLVLGAFAGGLLSERADAVPPEPHPGPSSPVREQNLDPEGLIRVHEQGVADVNVTNDVLEVQGTIEVDNFPTSFSVDNFPAEQDVRVLGTVTMVPSPASRLEQTILAADAGASDQFTFSTVNATTISISGLEVGTVATVSLQTPLNGGTTALTFPFGEDEANAPVYTFTQPVPIDGVTLSCIEGEDDKCVVFVDVIGG